MDIKQRAKKFIDDTKTGNKQTESLGAELAAKSQMLGNTPAPADKPATPPAAPASWEKVGRKYGDRPGEKVIDTSDMTKPLGSFAKGTDSVPKTGVYKVHEGEKIVSKENNDHDSDDESNHSPEEKAHFHRAMSHLHTGALHRHFGISEDKPIPMKKKQEAANSENPHVAAMGRMAVAMHGWKHSKK